MEWVELRRGGVRIEVGGVTKGWVRIDMGGVTKEWGEDWSGRSYKGVG